MPLDGQCPRCKRTDRLKYQHRWRKIQRCRRITSAEIAELALISLEEFELREGAVSESGQWVSFSTWASLWACAGCQRAWWTTQGALLSRAVDEEGMSAPEGMEYREAPALPALVEW